MSDRCIPSPTVDQMSEPPWLTVVTVVRNDRAGLAATAASLAEQAIAGVEHLVVDGASTDGTTQLARELARGSIRSPSGVAGAGQAQRSAHLCGVRVVSEPDNGIYDAMNKGWHLARGQVVHFLNAGDVYRSDSEIRAVRQKLAADPTAWLRTRVQFVDVSGAPSRPLASVTVSPGGFWWGWQPVAHQGAFMARALLAELGGFDTSLRIVADYDLMRRALALGVRPLTWDRVTVAVDDAGVSTQRYVQGFAEMHHARSAGRRPALRLLSGADALAHIAVVAGRRGTRVAAERCLGVQRVRRWRRLAR